MLEKGYLFENSFRINYCTNKNRKNLNDSLTTGLLNGHVGLNKYATPNTPLIQTTCIYRRYIKEYSPKTKEDLSKYACELVTKDITYTHISLFAYL